MAPTSGDVVTTADPPPRFVPGLRDLRLTGLGVVAASALLVIPFWGDVTLLLPTVTSHLLVLAAFPVFWLLAAWLGSRRIIPAVIVTVGSIAAVGFRCRRWWVVHEQSSIRLGLLLVMAMVSLGLGLFAVFNLLLRGIRNGMDPRPETPDDLARFRPLPRDPAPPGVMIRRPASVPCPAIALVVVVLLVHTFANPTSQVIASPPPGDPPTRPTRIGTTPAWEKDVPGLLEVAAGAAGPVLFTDEGLTALNPADGSTLWSYRHDKASYIRLPPLDYENPQGPRFTTSSTSHHIAFRIRSAKDLADQHRDSTDKAPVYDAVTITLDILTGQITGEHPSNTAWRIQLSDSAFLDSDTAHNLADGQRRWNIGRPRRSTLEPASKSTDYSGPAGHNSFILHYARNGLLGLHSDNVLYGNLIITSDIDPTKVSNAVSITIDGRHPAPVVAGGWVAQSTEPIDVQNSKPNKSRQTHEIIAKGIETQAVTLDSLAGLEPKSPVALGRMTDINSFTSSATGTLAAYLDYSLDTLPISDTHSRYNKPKVGAVFDPITRTTTQASRYPGLVAAKAGIAVTADDGSGTGAIIMQPGDDSQTITIPIAPGTTTTSPEALDARLPDALSQLATPDEEKDDSNIFMTAPGLTLVAFDPEAGIGYKTYIKEEEVGYVHRHVYRLYGLTGES